MFAELLARVARALSERGLPYMVIGGQAVLLHGEPRLTKDIDITLGVDLDRLETVLEAVRTAGLETLADPNEFTARTMVLPCRDAATEVRVDLIFSFSPYEREAIARSEPITLDGSEVRFATAEDLVIHKILAGRPRDLDDVRAILLKARPFDEGRTRRTLEQMETALDRSTELSGRFDSIWRQTRKGA